MPPLFANGLISNGLNLFIGLFIGIAFGFVLERSGLGTARNIAPTFYFRKMIVEQVMISAVVTATTWVVIFSLLGWIDFSKVFIPATYVWPYLVGGVLFGIGMVMGGYCPGTSVVASATGRIDGAVFAVGMVAGMWAYYEVYSAIQSFANSGYAGRFTWSKLLGGNMFSTSYIITVILGISILAFMGYMRNITLKKGDNR